jgi:2-polyprenyl-3-methyl-5-hydroxy-6-metoxy-1,4-benzoquinol methylase
MECVLCDSKNIEKIEDISVTDLNWAYLDEYQIDITGEIGSDISLMKCKDCDLRFFTPAYPGGESFYKKLQEFEWYYKEEKYEYDYVGDFLNTYNFMHKKVLEIGCGTGEFSSYIPQSEYCGLEFSTDAITKARSKGRNIRPQSIEDHSLQFKNYYDVVCSFQVLEHVKDPKSFINSCLHSLKPGGTLILTTPSEDSWIGHKQNFCLNLPPHHITRWTDDCFKNVAKQFKIHLAPIHHEPLDDFHHPWYLEAFFTHRINERLGIKQSVIRSQKHWLSHMLSMIIIGLIGNRVPESFRGIGHTAIATYTKPNIWDQ